MQMPNSSFALWLFTFIIWLFQWVFLLNNVSKNIYWWIPFSFVGLCCFSVIWSWNCASNSSFKSQKNMTEKCNNVQHWGKKPHKINSRQSQGLKGSCTKWCDTGITPGYNGESVLLSEPSSAGKRGQQPASIVRDPPGVQTVGWRCHRQMGCFSDRPFFHDGIPVLNDFFAPTAYTNSNQGGSSNELYRNNLRGSREHPCMVQPRRTVKTSMVQRSIRCGVHSAPLFFHLLIHRRFCKYYNNR